MKRLLAAAGALLAVLVAALVMVVTGGTGQQPPTAGCSPTSEPVVDGGQVPGLDAVQSKRATQIVQVGVQLGVPEKGLIVALATARQESGLRNLASMANPGSLVFPHDAVAQGDHDSVGLFQQRDAWGSLAERMDPAASARMFYTGGHAGQRGLLDVPGWQSMPVTVAAQAVQVSAYPAAYADDEPVATAAVHAILGGTSVVPAVDCTTQPVVAGDVVWPEPKSTDRRNYGGSGSLWAHGHTGTDFSVACGTPVHAATGGVVHIDTSQGWAGTWLVKVSTGEHSLTTWYAHMQALSVHEGQAVVAGQVLGEVGQRGNATGCHLHFEVHPTNGGIYEDGVNPSVWLDQHAGHQAPGGTVPVVQPPPAPAGPEWFRIASFNVLGSSHTIPGHSEHPGFPQGPARMRGAVAVLEHYGIDVAGLQEFTPNQKQAFLRYTGGTWGVWSGSGDTENSIAWRKSKWTFVSGGTYPIRYFYGHTRRVPVVRLRSARGDIIVTNTHNPANVRGNARAWREEDKRRQVALIAGLIGRYHLPVFITGDFNEKSSLFCDLTANGLLHNAGGGSVGRPCRLPKYVGIDWIFGSRDVTFTGFGVDKTLKARRITDHPIVMAAVG